MEEQGTWPGRKTTIDRTGSVHMHQRASYYTMFLHRGRDEWAQLQLQGTSEKEKKNSTVKKKKKKKAKQYKKQKK